MLITDTDCMFAKSTNRDDLLEKGWIDGKPQNQTYKTDDTKYTNITAVSNQNTKKLVVQYLHRSAGEENVR